MEFLPNLIVSNFGSSKALFRKLYLGFSKLNKSEMFRHETVLNGFKHQYAHAYCTASVVWRGVAVFDRIPIWFDTQL